MKRLLPLSLVLLLVAGCSSLRTTTRHTGPWNLAALKQTPAAQWGGRTGLVQEVYYQGEPYRGKPTRVFAYLGRPAAGKGPFPAMVLVHGGGGKAFRDWAEHWAQRGYVALAMDTAGCGPDGPLADGGPDQTDVTKFRDFTDDDGRRDVDLPRRQRRDSRRVAAVRAARGGPSPDRHHRHQLGRLPDVHCGGP